MAKYLDGTGLSKAFELIKIWVTTNFLSDVSYDSTSKKIQKTKNGTTSDVVALATVATSGSYNDLSNTPTIPSGVSPYDSNPAMDGTASPGSSSLFARGDHVHPTDTSRAANTDFTGATTNAGGAHGLVPAPASGETTKLLWGDGYWKKPHLAYEVTNGNLVVNFQKTNESGYSTASSITIPLNSIDPQSWSNIYPYLYFDTTADEYFLQLRFGNKQIPESGTVIASCMLPAATTTTRGMMRASDKVILETLWNSGDYQSDWNQSDSTAADFIKNKPTIPTIPNPSIYHAVCETATSTAAKTATLDDSSGFPSSSQLTAGVVVAVTFMNGNSAASPTLNIQDTGAYPLRIEGRSPASTSVQTAPIINDNSHCTLLLTFNGSQWVEYEQFNGFGTAAWKDYQDSSSASALSTGTDLVTERDVYHGLPKINNAHNYTSGTNIYAPTSAGTSGYYLKANGGTSAPTWQAPGSVADGNTGLVTGDAVYDAIQDALGDVAGALVYKGTAATASAIIGTSYKKGWYWIASATFALTSGINVEPGDMIIAKQDKTSTFANDIDVIQTNIDTLTEAEVTALWNAA